MEVKASAKYIRQSPRKVRLIAAVIRKMDAGLALNKLAIVNKKATLPVLKLLKSTIANAEHNFNLVKENLFIKEIRVEDGPTLFRWMPRAQGRATPIAKRTSHVYLILAEKNVTTKGKSKNATKENNIETVKLEDANAEFAKEDKKSKQKGNGGPSKTGKNQKGVLKKMFQRKTGV